MIEGLFWCDVLGGVYYYVGLGYGCCIDGFGDVEVGDFYLFGGGD